MVVVVLLASCLLLGCLRLLGFVVFGCGVDLIAVFVWIVWQCLLCFISLC